MKEDELGEDSQGGLIPQLQEFQSLQYVLLPIDLATPIPLQVSEEIGYQGQSRAKKL
jgi:hypothetical protein